MPWHMEDTIMVLKEVSGPHPWCDKFYMFITQEAMASGHLGITMCKNGGKRKHHHLPATAAQLAAGTEFRVQDQVLEKLDTFNYLVRMLYFDDRYWKVMARNLHKD